MGLEWRTLLDIGAIASICATAVQFIRARGQNKSELARVGGQNQAEIGAVLVDQVEALQTRNAELARRIDGLQVVAVTNERLSGQIERLGDQMTLLIEERRKMTQRSEQNTARIAELEKQSTDLEQQNKHCRELLDQQQKMVDNQQTIIERLQQVQRSVNGEADQA